MHYYAYCRQVRIVVLVGKNFSPNISVHYVVCCLTVSVCSDVAILQFCVLLLCIVLRSVGIC